MLYYNARERMSPVNSRVGESENSVRKEDKIAVRINLKVQLFAF